MTNCSCSGHFLCPNPIEGARTKDLLFEAAAKRLPSLLSVLLRAWTTLNEIGRGTSRDRKRGSVLY